MRLPLRFAVLCGLVPAFLLIASCGGSDVETVDADDWVADVCDLATGFDEEFADAGGALTVLDDGDPDEIKDAIDEFVDEASELIDEFVADVEEVGKPDIEGGSDVLKAFNEHAKDQKGSLTGFRDDVEDLDDDDDEDFRQDVLELIDDAEDFDLRDRLEDIDENDVDDLIDTIDEDPGCAAALFSS